MGDHPAVPASSEARYLKTSSARPSDTSCSAVLNANAGRASFRNQIEAPFTWPLRSVAAVITRCASRDPPSPGTLEGVIEAF